MQVKEYINAYKQIDSETRSAWSDLSEKIVDVQTRMFAKTGLYIGPNETNLTDIQKILICGYGDEAFIAWDDRNGDILAKIHFHPDAEERAENELKALDLAKEHNIQNVPRPIALHKNILVETACIGQALTELNSEKALDITEDQLITLFKTIDQLIKVGIQVETSPQNFLFHKESGFTVLDFSMKNGFDNFEKAIDYLRSFFEDQLNLGDLFRKAFNSYMTSRQVTSIDKASAPEEEPHADEAAKAPIVSKTFRKPKMPLIAGRDLRDKGGYGQEGRQIIIDALKKADIWTLANKARKVDQGKNRKEQQFDKLDDNYHGAYKTGAHLKLSARTNGAQKKDGKEMAHKTISLSGYSPELIKNIFDPVFELDLLGENQEKFLNHKAAGALKEYFSTMQTFILDIFNEIGLSRHKRRTISIGASTKERSGYIELTHAVNSQGQSVYRIKGFPTKEPFTIDLTILKGGSCELSYSKIARADSLPKLIYRAEQNTEKVFVKRDKGEKLELCDGVVD